MRLTVSWLSIPDEGNVLLLPTSQSASCSPFMAAQIGAYRIPISPPPTSTLARPIFGTCRRWNSWILDSCYVGVNPVLGLPGLPHRMRIDSPFPDISVVRVCDPQLPACSVPPLSKAINMSHVRPKESYNLEDVVKDNKGKMEYAYLGKSGLRVSKICLGMMS
jgi:hypothetical protein